MPASQWQWDECAQVGTDYRDVEEVRTYDERMAVFRDVEAETARILRTLQPASRDTVLEIGAGTGAFTRAAAAVCRRVIAVDISPVMLAYNRERATREGLANIDFVEGGFLTYRHEAPPADAAVSQLALHHLPDLWKLVGLTRLAHMLRPGGKLFLQDVVFTDEAGRDAPAYFARLAARLPDAAREGFVQHVREEFSTLDWVIEGILQRSGFEVLRKELRDGFLAEYLCARV